MADNIGYTPGSGAVIAADDIGGALHQRVKMVVGADGVSDGDVSLANPLPVSDAGGGSLLRQILRVLLAPLGYDKSLQRGRVTAVVESGTVTNVTTVAKLSNQVAIGGIQAQILVSGQNVSAWQSCVRSRIT